MNVITATEHLIKWFETNDGFSISRDFKSLFPNYISDTPENDKAALLAALEELSNNSIIRKAAFNKLDYYILIKPLIHLNQNVTISYMTIKLLSNILNTASEKLQNKEITFDPLRIEEKDILLAFTLMNELIMVNKENK
jgi:hypothetical protein